MSDAEKFNLNSDWQEPYRILPLKLHSDHRGDLFEMLRFTSHKIPMGGQIYVYSVAPGERRGDHYHVGKGEWFTCVSGSAEVLIKTGDGAREKFSLESHSPALVYVGPYTSHALVNHHDSLAAVIVAYGSKEFDPAEPDTYPEKSD